MSLRNAIARDGDDVSIGTCAKPQRPGLESGLPLQRVKPSRMLSSVGLFAAGFVIQVIVFFIPSICKQSRADCLGQMRPYNSSAPLSSSFVAWNESSLCRTGLSACRSCPSLLVHGSGAQVAKSQRISRGRQLY